MDMERELYYSSIDAATNSAVMRLYGEIGCEISGSAFAAEMLYLCDEGIDKIDIRINSCGGSVIEAFTIFSAITTSKADITTYNDGIAASSAGWIFLAAKNAVMADYALLMVHNPSSADTSKKGLERLDFMRNSIITILAKRTGNSAESVGAMMDEETWFDATSALDSGFATAIEETKLLIELAPAMQTANVMYEICNSAITKINSDMEEDTTEKVTDELVEATTDETPEVVEVITNEVVEEAVDVVVEVVEKETPDAVVEDVVNTLDIVNYKNRIAELESELQGLKDAETQRVNDEKQTAGMELVTNAIATGKIKSEASAEWIILAVSNYAFAKSTLDAIAVNKPGVDIMNAVKVDDKPKMTLREMEKKDAKGVENMYRNNRALYNQMYFEQYGIMPR